jgi:hypothetical protein
MNRYGRVGEIFLALHHVAPTEEIRSILAEFERGVYEDLTEDEATSMDAEVVRAIVECWNLAKDKDDLKKDNRLPIQSIVKIVNSDRDPGDQISPRLVGRATNRLGFRKARMGDSKGSRAIRLDIGLLHRLMQTYDIPSEERQNSQNDRIKGEFDKFTSDNPTMSEALQPEITHVSDNSDVLTVKRAYEPTIEKIGNGDDPK